MIKKAVEIYNNERTHWSLDLKTPQEAHDEFNKHIYKSYSKKSCIMLLLINTAIKCGKIPSKTN